MVPQWLTSIIPTLSKADKTLEDIHICSYILCVSLRYMSALLHNLVPKGNFSMTDLNIKGHGNGFTVRLVLDVQDYMHR